MNYKYKVVMYLYNKNALNGEIVAPVSLKRIALIFVTNAAGPQAFVKLIPW